MCHLVSSVYPARYLRLRLLQLRIRAGKMERTVWFFWSSKERECCASCLRPCLLHKLTMIDVMAALCSHCSCSRWDHDLRGATQLSASELQSSTPTAAPITASWRCRSHRFSENSWFSGNDFMGRSRTSFTTSVCRRPLLLEHRGGSLEHRAAAIHLIFITQRYGTLIQVAGRPTGITQRYLIRSTLIQRLPQRLSPEFL